MKPFNPTRRRLMGAMPTIVLGGIAGPGLLTQFIREANAQSSGDYKALVCMNFSGGNDAFNTVLATDSGSWARYQGARNTGADPFALLGPGAAPVAAGDVSPLNGRTVSRSTQEFFGGVLPIVPRTPLTVPGSNSADPRTFAVHPLLGSIQGLFQARRLAVIANVGPLLEPTTKAGALNGSGNLPENLFSHNDQTDTWQRSSSQDSIVGWGGLFADSVQSLNGSNAIFTSVSAIGATTLLTGQLSNQYQLDTGSVAAPVIDTSGEFSDMSSAMLSVSSADSAHYLAGSYAKVVQRSIRFGGVINSALTAAGPASVAPPSQMINPITGGATDNALAIQLQLVARMIAAGQGLGLKRQLFIVGLNGFDQHSTLNVSHPPLLASIDHAFDYFDQTLSTLGGSDMRNNVTTFTTSEFGRGLTSNGDGCDHGWGGHHFVMGGSVKGGDIYGTFPTIGQDLGSFTNPDAANNGVMIPTTSVDQYAATLGSWFGVDSASIDAAFPNLSHFSSRNLGFI